MVDQTQTTSVIRPAAAPTMPPADAATGLSDPAAVSLRAGHHPSTALLTAYAAGSLGEGLSLLVAAHLTFCPNCRNAVATLEAAGGALMDSLEPIALRADALEAALARLDDPPATADTGPNPPRPLPLSSSGWGRRPTSASASASASAGGSGVTRPVPSTAPRPARGGSAARRPLLPAPLREILGADDPAALPWRRLGPGIRQIVVPTATTAPHKTGKPFPIQTRLLWLDGNRPLPHHGHRGGEYTLVLDGGFSDHLGHFLPGDVAELDPDIDHQPVVDAEGCLCLIVTEAPLRYSGLINRLVQPFTGL